MQRRESRLAELAGSGQTVTCGALARSLGPRMGGLTEALETLMATDAAAGRPVRAALCEAKLGNGLPAFGFFQVAQALGRDFSDPVALVAAERAALFRDARSG